MGRLGRMRVAVIVADGFEPAELDLVVLALRDAGASVDVLAPDEDHHGRIDAERVGAVIPDRLLADASPEAYDALVIPGGEASADAMSRSSLHLHWVRRMVERQRPIGAIGEGVRLLGDADTIHAHVVTSAPICRPALEEAGARWIDQEVVVDRGLVTSRAPRDLPAFTRALLELLEREYVTLVGDTGTAAEPIDGGSLR